MRTTLVSTSKLKTGKIIGIVITLTLVALVCSTAVMQLISGRSIGSIFYLAFWFYAAYRIISLILRLKNISYDDSSVYYNRQGFEVQIPFEEIKNMEIKTITGVYTINLFRPSQDGDSIPFKMSLWYPFNFKKQDEMVNVLRDKIHNYKRQLRPHYHDELPSRSIS